MKGMTDYPEHEKLKAIKDKSQEIGSFIEWLQVSRQIIFARYEDVEYTVDDLFSDKGNKVKINELVPFHIPIEQTLAEYFGINLKKLEEEKRQMLDDIRKANEEKR